MSRTLVFAILFPLISTLSAGAPLSMLSAEDEDSLKPAARARYREGVKLLDKVAPELALPKFDEASKLDAAHIPIRLLVAKLAISQGDARSGLDADNCYRMAENRMNEVLRRSPLDMGTVARAQELLQQAQDKRKSRPQRDAAKSEAGRRYVEKRTEELRAETDRPDVLDRINARKREAAELARQRNESAARYRSLYDYYDRGYGYYDYNSGVAPYDSYYGSYYDSQGRYNSNYGNSGSSYYYRGGSYSSPYY